MRSAADPCGRTLRHLGEVLSSELHDIPMMTRTPVVSADRGGDAQLLEGFPTDEEGAPPRAEEDAMGGRARFERELATVEVQRRDADPAADEKQEPVVGNLWPGKRIWRRSRIWRNSLISALYCCSKTGAHVYRNLRIKAGGRLSGVPGLKALLF